MTLVALHRALAVALCLFAVPHLLGHLSGLWGPDAFNATLDRLRPFYRHPAVEPVLLMVAVGQALLGLLMLWRRGRRGWRPGLLRWQSISGLIVALFLLQHIPAMALARWGWGLDTTYWWPASVAGSLPFALYFWPYYLTGIAAFVLHIAIAVSLTLRRRGRPRAARLALLAGGGAGVALGASILAGISGLLHDQPMPATWQAYLAALLPFGRL